MSNNKAKAQQYRQTEAYKLNRRMYNMRPEVRYRRAVKAKMKRAAGKH